MLDEVKPTFGEKLYTVKEAATYFGWSYDTAHRHFRDVSGILRRSPRGRILIPESTLKREWGRLTSATLRPAQAWKRRSLARQPKLTTDQWAQIEKLMAEGKPIMQIAKKFDVTRQTIYKHAAQNKTA